MSAYVCSDKHIATLVIGVSQMPYSPVKIETAQAAANLLKRENIRSVNYRYNQSNRVYPVDLTEGHNNVSLRALIQLAKCLDYQSCERPDYVKSRANHLLMRILAFLLLELPEVKTGLASCEVWSI